MEKFRILSLLWMLFLLNVLETINAQEGNGYIFTCPRSLKTGAKNQMLLRRFGALDAGVLTVNVTYSEGYSANGTTSIVKSFDIPEGEVDSYLELFLENPEEYVYNGKITINGTFDDGAMMMRGTDKVQFTAATDNVAFLQTDKPLYKDGQTVKFRVMRVDKELKPVVKDTADVSVEDPQGTRLFQWKNVSLGKGIKQFEFPLANEPVKGDWKISTNFKGDITTTTFEVKEYVLPKFEVKIKVPPFVLANAEVIPINVCAKYTYGKPVKGNVKMNISLETYTWSNDKLPTQEFSEEINGCFDYNINVSLIETEDYYRYRRIQIVVSVEESGTGVQRNETQYIQRQYSPLTLSFNREQRQFYKPGLPYNGKLFVKYPDSSPAPDEGIQVCYTVTKERVVMDGQWKATRTVKYCQNFTSDANGVVEFVIPRQNTDSVGINIEAKSLKYAKEKDKPTGTPRQSSLSQPHASMSLTPWFSPSGSFIQLQQVQETLLCGTKRTIKLLFTSKDEGDYKFYYQVSHQGVITQRGFVEKSFKPEDDVADEYEDESKVVDDSEVQIVPAIDPSQPPSSDDEQCKSAKEAKYVPYVGVADIDVTVDPALAPSFYLLVYYIRDDRETVADSQKFTVEKCFKNQVKFQFGDDVKQPATKTSIKVTSSPNSLCGIKVVDKSISLLNSDDQLTRDKIFRALDSFDSGVYYGNNHCNEEVRQPGLYKTTSDIIMPPQPWSSSSYEDSLAAFETSGFLVISDLILFTRPCKSRGNGGNVFYDDRYEDAQVVRGGAVHSKVAMASVARRPAAPGAAGFSANEKMGDVATKSVVDVRSYFPDTWLFELEMTGEDGVYLTKEKLPHTITEWVGSAVCINDEDGLGLSNTTSIKGFQAFFISSTVPYSVIRGESFWMTVQVFSYVDKPLPITVTVDELEGFEITSDSIDGDICIPPESSINLRIQLKGKELGNLSITVRAETAQSSDVCGSDDVSDALAKDAIESKVIVEPEGWPAENVESFLFCPKEEENGVFKKTFSATENDDIVPDSTRFYMDVSGSMIGKSMNNLERLVEVPTGCGEQNMVKFAPNVVVMEVLIDTNQLTEKIEKRIIRNLNTGAQRQSQFRRSDGSYSAFGHRDKEGSMFLSAFVLNYFSRAAEYITIDNNTIAQIQYWITSKQQADGSFLDVGKIIDRDIQGGLLKDKSNCTITAYVTASLLISGYQNKTVLDLAFSYIENCKDTSFYATFLYAYAEASAGKEDAAKKRLESVKDKSIKKGGTEYYHDVNATKSQDVETSAYYVLATLKSGGSAADVLPVMQYLGKNMNPQGGFISTQDTVVGLDAVGNFAKITMKDEVDINIQVTGGLEKDIQVSEDDKLVVKRYKIEDISSEVNVEASGSGCALIQSILRYNTKTPPEKRSFILEVVGKCLNDQCNRGSISTSVSNIEEQNSGMSLVEIRMISGWFPDKETIEKLLDDKTLNIKRYDVENNVVVFYFDEINSEKSFTFEVEQTVEVENTQPGTAKATNYYKRDYSSSAIYYIGNCDEESESCPKEP